MYVLPDSASLINQRPDENDNNLLFNTEIALFLHTIYTLTITQVRKLMKGSKSKLKFLNPQIHALLFIQLNIGQGR